jgi:mono/diheme cytochrome c family protein
VTLGLDIDAPHPAGVVPAQTPAAALGTAVPFQFLNRDVYLTQSPAAVWQMLRAAPELAGFDDAALWNMVAFIWQSQATDEQRQMGAALYAQNCAACHGRTGQGDGVFGQEFDQATNFTDAKTMLGASTAVLDGKIRRGGMGTGMPYWGTIFTDEEIEALIAYLWTFQFQ